MGQQQLLLIVLGVIIVGIAVVVGINLFSSQAENSSQDAVVADCTNLGALAQQYYKKPVAMGGGGNSFVGFAVPANLDTTANGTYAITGTTTAAAVQITGTPLTSTGYTWSVETDITPTGIVSAIN